MINDRRAVELGLFPRLFAQYTLLAAELNASDMELVSSFFMVEESVCPKSAERAKKRLRIVSGAVQTVLHGNKLPVVFLALSYALRDKLEAGKLVLAEGSVFDKAYERLKDEWLRKTTFWESEEQNAECLSSRIGQIITRYGYFTH